MEASVIPTVDNSTEEEVLEKLIDAFISGGEADTDDEASIYAESTVRAALRIAIGRIEEENG